MDFIKKYEESYPTSYKILTIVVILLLTYKFGYLVGKFVANIGL